MADNAQNTFIVVGPNGEILYEFNGKITADGLIMQEGDSTNPFTTFNVIEWLKEGGKRSHEFISAVNEVAPNALHYLQLASRGDEAKINANAILTLISSDTEIPKGVIGLSYGVGVGNSGYIMNGNGESNFLQLPSTAKRKISFGTAELNFVASKIPEGPIEVSHGLGTTPLVVLATPENNVVTTSTSAYGATTFKLWGGNWFEPLSGKVKVRWIAIG